MNTLDWDAIQRLQRALNTNQQSSVNNGFDNASETNNNQNTYCEYLRYTVDKPQSSVGVNVGWKEPCPASHDFYIQESEVEDPDGVPLVIEEEDSELARKRKELREIEEQIKQKKVAIALKKVEPFVKKASLGFSCNEESDPCEGPSLRDRVNAILQQRHPVSFRSKVRSPTERLNSSSLSKKRLLQDDHPLKLRVKALMKQRLTFPFVLPTYNEVPDIKQPSPSQRDASAEKEENSVDLGFQRFLSVLNKGVDMDMLSRIVNNDGENLPLDEEPLNMQPPALENKSDPPLRSESQRSNSGASLPGHSRTSSGERKTDLSSQERSLSERLSLPDDERKKNSKGDRCFASSSRSKSPPSVKSKKKKKEEEPQKLDEHHEHLQNILKTLGLSLEVEEMSKLADRTQERLYGKNRADSRGEPERGSHKHDRNSSPWSSSSSSSSYSGSTSRSPSPSRRPPSKGRNSKQRKASERSGSKDRSKDELTEQDRKQDSKEAPRQRDRDKDDKAITVTSTYEHPYPHQSIPLHLPPWPAGFPAFPDYSFQQYSQDNAYHSNTYSTPTNFYWTDPQGAQPPPFYPNEYDYPQDPFYHFPGPAAAPKRVCHRKLFEDINLLVNPDLSRSEGQTGPASGTRCLQVVTTKQTTSQNCLKTLIGSKRRKRGNPESHTKRRRIRRKQKKGKKTDSNFCTEGEGKGEGEGGGSTRR
uniref:uncharacterized protein n=1 Tax=Semicossyphus pulcher TaxID=241346 RepID=UPI0037E9BD8E